MCGIAGIWSPPGQPPPRRDEIASMVRMLLHRGPDAQGVHLDGPIGLGHARLSIIDLAGGAQPLSNEDGTIWLTFNGEIFNYIELRRELKRLGHRFKSETDSEVLVHLYEEHGDDFVQHLNGQFAFALWDGRRQRLLLARDRLGIRPLHYTHDRGRFAFASEAKSLFALPSVPRRLSADALASTFSYWAALPPDTIFEGVRQIPPGHLLSVDAGGETLQRYWDWTFPQTAPTVSDDALAEELRALLIDAVRLQLRADVPVGAYLSGGLDSTIITTCVARHSDTPLRTFSLTFDDGEFDESLHQAAVVRHLHTEHSSIRTSHDAIGAAFQRLVWHAEAPIVRSAPVPMMLLADSVRSAGFKVVLTGEGADEAFGGYDLFKEAALRRFAARSPGSKARRSLIGRLYPYLAHSPAALRHLSQGFFDRGLHRPTDPGFAHQLRLATTRRIFQFFAPDWQQRLLDWDPDAALARLLPTAFCRWQALERDQYVEANTLLPGYLLSAQGDRAAMAASIEARFPFLDHRVVEFAGRLPPRLKLRGLYEKVLLKRAFAAQLPASIVDRKKQPYRAPDSACFFSEQQPLPWVEDLLSPSRLARTGIFSPEAVIKLVEKCRLGRAIGFGDNMAFMGVLSTMLLHRQFIEPTGPPTAPG